MMTVNGKTGREDGGSGGQETNSDGLGGQWRRGRKGCKLTVLDDQGRTDNKREKRAELRWLL